MSTEIYDKHLADWQQREATAEAMLPLIGRLYREQGVVTLIYGRPLINRSVIAILKAHRFVRQVDDQELPVADSYAVLKALSEMQLAAARIDLAKLTLGYLASGKSLPVADYVASQVSQLAEGEAQILEQPQDVVLYGFGRIGRLLARLLVERVGSGQNLRLRAIVVRKGGADDLHKRASLLRRDSVHGSFQGSITVDESAQALIINGNYVHVIYSDGPDQVDYTQYGIDNALVIDNTGKWRDADGLGLHLQAKGAAKVLLTAPGKGDIKNIVYGVNHADIAAEDRVVSAASCTTNAIVPVLKAINDQYGIVSGHVETVHSYTNDQNLIDNYHKASRRGRSAPLNMVITETGAAKAVAKALPELKGKLTGNAIRVPTPNVSLAILNLTLETGTDVDALNAYMRDVALNSALQKQIDYTNSPEIVSSDLVGSRHAGVFDSLATIVNDTQCVLYVWYDNEFGYSSQVVRIVQHMAGIVYPTLPA